MQNEDKNRLIRSTYIFNPVSFVQNVWNSCTSTDYDSYKNFRSEIENLLNLEINYLFRKCGKKRKLIKKFIMSI